MRQNSERRFLVRSAIFMLEKKNMFFHLYLKHKQKIGQILNLFQILLSYISEMLLPSHSYISCLYSFCIWFVFAFCLPFPLIFFQDSLSALPVKLCIVYQPGHAAGLKLINRGRHCCKRYEDLSQL